MVGSFGRGPSLAELNLLVRQWHGEVLGLAERIGKVLAEMDAGPVKSRTRGSERELRQERKARLREGKTAGSRRRGQDLVAEIDRELSAMRANRLAKRARR